MKTSHDNGETWIWHERDDAMSEDPNMFVVTPAISVPYPAVGTKGICSGQRSICGLENILVPDNSPVFEYDIGNDGFTYVTSLPNLKVAGTVAVIRSGNSYWGSTSSPDGSNVFFGLQWRGTSIESEIKYHETGSSYVMSVQASARRDYGDNEKLKVSIVGLIHGTSNTTEELTHWTGPLSPGSWTLIELSFFASEKYSKFSVLLENVSPANLDKTVFVDALQVKTADVSTPGGPTPNSLAELGICSGHYNGNAYLYLDPTHFIRETTYSLAELLSMVKLASHLSLSLVFLSLSLCFRDLVLENSLQTPTKQATRTSNTQLCGSCEVTITDEGHIHFDKKTEERSTCQFDIELPFYFEEIVRSSYDIYDINGAEQNMGTVESISATCSRSGYEGAALFGTPSGLLVNRAEGLNTGSDGGRTLTVAVPDANFNSTNTLRFGFSQNGQSSDSEDMEITDVSFTFKRLHVRV